MLDRDVHCSPRDTCSEEAALHMPAGMVKSYSIVGTTEEMNFKNNTI